MTAVIDAEDAQRDLPEATFLPWSEPETPAWFAQRREGITATDLPKILGLSRYGNALSVWMDKRGDLGDDGAGEAARWGQLLEPVIAAEYAARTERIVVPVPVAARTSEPWMRCSLDRLVHVPQVDEVARVRTIHSGTVVGALEVKNRNAFVAGDWREEVPDDVLAQVQYQLLVTGLDWIDVAALIGGNHLQVHRIEREDPLLHLVRSEAERVWEAVLDGVPPYVDPDAQLLRLLDRIYPNRAGVRRLDGVDLALAREHLADLEAAKAEIKAAQEREVVAKAALVQLLDDDEEAVDPDDDWLFRYRKTTRAGYTVAPTEFRQLTFNRRRTTP